jgi:hypothetical protein
MREGPGSAPLPAHSEAADCAYILGDPRAGSGAWRRCPELHQPGSSYCPHHHARCHLTGGSAAERRRLREVERLADAVGGRRSGENRGPPARFLARLERLVRGFS